MTIRMARPVKKYITQYFKIILPMLIIGLILTIVAIALGAEGYGDRTAVPQNTEPVHMIVSADENALAEIRYVSVEEEDGDGDPVTGLFDHEEAEERRSEEKTEVSEVERLMMMYSNAELYMENGRYGEAAEIFEQCAEKGFTDSAARVAECREFEQYMGDYLRARELEEAMMYEDAAALYEEFRGFRDCDERAENCRHEIKYLEAFEAYSEGKPALAADIFDDLGTYKNSRANALVTRSGYAVPGYDCIYFGRFEQDGDYGNGSERLEWEMVCEDDDSVTLQSRYLIHSRPYQWDAVSTTWESSNLREWLNGTFLRDAFTAAEKQSIMRTVCEASDNPEYGTSGGNSTEDYVWIFSVQQALEYGIGMVETTKNAISDAGPGNFYFLRTPGYKKSMVAGISADGTIDYVGASVHYYNYIRPVVRIKSR